MANAPLSLNPEICERARVARDPRFDGRFFIGVHTTGIYCRPVCPAISPKPGNFSYYPSAAAAAEAGLRPCLRCRPEAAPGTPAWLGTSAIVRRALRLINDGALDRESVEEFATRLGVSSRHLDRLFVEHLGASPSAVAQTRRLHFAKRLIDETRLPMTEIAMASGFGSLRRFNDAFRHTYGRAPRELRRNRRGPPPQNDALTLRLAYRPPYDWEAILEFFAARALPGVERVTAERYARTVYVNGSAGWIELRPATDAHALDLTVHGFEASALFGISQRVRQMFDLGADPGDVKRTLGRDRLLAPLLRRRPGLRVPGAWDPFELSVRAVLGQQVSVAAARTFAARIVARHGRALVAPMEGLSRLFPEPRALAIADLGDTGLTRRRALTVNALAAAVAAGEICFQDTGVEAVRAAMQRVRGIGAWTVEYIALRALADPDAFPVGDLVLRRVAGRGQTLGEKALLAKAEHWRPWRAYAALYLWRAASDTDRSRGRQHEQSQNYVPLDNAHPHRRPVAGGRPKRAVRRALSGWPQSHRARG